MKKQILILTVISFLMSSCGLFHRTNYKKNKILKEIAEYPQIKDLEKKILFFPESNKEFKDNDLMVEVFAGKNVMADCNYHSLGGNFIKKKSEKNGKPFYIFESNGDVFSTMMACPDEKKQNKFVRSESLMLPYKTNKPYVFYTSPKFQIKYRLWKSQNLESFLQENKKSETKELKKILSYYPIEIEGWKRDVIYLPKMANQNQEDEYKVEIIPTEECNLDCSTYRLLGRFKEQNIEGMGFPYFIFLTNGTVLTEKFNCSKNSRKNKTVVAQGKLLNYNSNLPIVVFVPTKINLKYKVWKATEKTDNVQCHLETSKKKQITYEEYEKLEDKIWLDFLQNATQLEIYKSLITSKVNVNSFLYRWIKDNPNVDKATVLTAYWRVLPTLNNKRYNDREDFIKRRGEEEVVLYDFIEEVEKKYADGFYKVNEISFNPRDDINHRDWTDEADERGLAFVVSRSVPSIMYRSVKGKIELKEYPIDFDNGLPTKPINYAHKVYQIFDKYAVK